MPSSCITKKLSLSFFLGGGTPNSLSAYTTAQRTGVCRPPLSKSSKGGGRMGFGQPFDRLEAIPQGHTQTTTDGPHTASSGGRLQVTPGLPSGVCESEARADSRRTFGERPSPSSRPPSYPPPLPGQRLYSILFEERYFQGVPDREATRRRSPDSHTGSVSGASATALRPHLPPPAGGRERQPSVRLLLKCSRRQRSEREAGPRPGLPSLSPRAHAPSGTRVRLRPSWLRPRRWV